VDKLDKLDKGKVELKLIRSFNFYARVLCSVREHPFLSYRSFVEIILVIEPRTCTKGHMHTLSLPLLASART
jgi:hypothetical protein